MKDGPVISPDRDRRADGALTVERFALGVGGGARVHGVKDRRAVEPWYSTRMRVFLLALCLPACATSWSDADTQANTIGARNEARVLEMCTGDAGECTPSRVRAFTLLAFCSNARELAVHGSGVDAGGPPCRP